MDENKKPEAKKIDGGSPPAPKAPAVVAPEPAQPKAAEVHPDAHREYAGLPDMQLGTWPQPKAP